MSGFYGDGAMCGCNADRKCADHTPSQPTRSAEVPFVAPAGHREATAVCSCARGCRTREEMQKAHGTPEQFEQAIARAAADFTVAEAEAAVLKYRTEWAAATQDAAESVAIGEMRQAVADVQDKRDRFQLLAENRRLRAESLQALDIASAAEKCWECRGRGKVSVSEPTLLGVMERCVACNGTGRVTPAISPQPVAANDSPEFWVESWRAAKYQTLTPAFVEAIQMRLRAENERLTRGVVANAGRLATVPRVRWAHIVDAVGVGSTTAKAMCRDAGFDPDEVVPEREPDACDHCENPMDGDACCTSDVCWDCWRQAKERIAELETFPEPDETAEPGTPERLSMAFTPESLARHTVRSDGDGYIITGLAARLGRAGARIRELEAAAGETAQRAAVAAFDAMNCSHWYQRNVIADGREVWDGTEWKAKS